MSESFQDLFALRNSTAESKGNRHSDYEQEGGKNQIDERHSAALGMTVAVMHHPVGHDLPGAGEVVHENHHEHHKPAQRVNGGEACGLNAGFVVQRHQCGRPASQTPARFLASLAPPEGSYGSQAAPISSFRIAGFSSAITTATQGVSIEVILADHSRVPALPRFRINSF